MKPFQVVIQVLGRYTVKACHPFFEATVKRVDVLDMVNAALNSLMVNSGIVDPGSRTIV